MSLGKKHIWLSVILCLVVGKAGAALLSETARSVEVIHGEKLIKVQPTKSRILFPPSTDCFLDCLQRVVAAPGVMTIAEVELLGFLKELAHERLEVYDVRTELEYSSATIPGSKHLSMQALVLPPLGVSKGLSTLFEKSLNVRKRTRVSRFVRWLESLGFLGGRYKTDEWDFTDAKEMVLWCGDATCASAAKAIQTFIDLGYPAERLYYYRGGIHAWAGLGLTVVHGKTGELVQPDMSFRNQ